MSTKPVLLSRKPPNDQSAFITHEAVCNDASLRLASHLHAVHELGSCLEAIQSASETLARALNDGQKVLVAGNGGSAAEAQHFASELVGRFKRERCAYPVIALCTDSSILTALGNDFGFDQIFERQVEAFATPGDVLVAISTSGTSENVVRAARRAKLQQARVIAMTGQMPGPLEAHADVHLQAPSVDTPTIQECHMLLTHLICGLVEAVMCELVNEGQS